MYRKNIFNYIIMADEVKDIVKIKEEDSKVYGHQRAKFEGFGTYGKYDIADRVNELMEITKKEYPTLDNYLLWLISVDYILKDELKVEIDESEAQEMYENYKKERNTFVYDTVQIVDVQE